MEKGRLAAFLLFKFWQIKLWRNAHSGIDHPLLSNRKNVVRDPVQHQTSREKEKHHAKNQGHEPHQLGLHWIRWRRIQCGLQHGGGGHHYRQNKIRVRRRQVCDPQHPGRIAPSSNCCSKFLAFIQCHLFCACATNGYQSNVGSAVGNDG